jgi:phage terminase small subunit
MAAVMVEGQEFNLTYKQEAFVNEYLVDLNATQAAIRAGYSEDTAGVIGSENLKKPYIREAIQKAMDSRAERTKITADRVLNELGKMGFANIRDIFTESGNLRPINELPEHVAAAIQSVEVTVKSGDENEDGSRTVENVHKVRLADKKAPLELLGKHLKLFAERVEHTGKDGGEIHIHLSTDDTALL